MKAITSFPYILYLFINFLFIIKYTSRETIIHPAVATVLYLVMNIGFVFFIKKLNQKEYIYKYLFWIISLLFFLFTIYLNYIVDGNLLNVDRWSAMHVAIEALINGDYPYSAIDHANGRTSNLPTLIFIGIPFYFLGSVSHLQSFSFLLLVYLLYKIFDSYTYRFLGLILLIVSPSYLWEIYAKSDLMSNFVIVLAFCYWVFSISQQQDKNNPSLLSFLGTALLLTRLTVIIPLTLLLFKKFFNFNVREKFIFLLTGVVTAVIFLTISFMNVSSWEHFQMHNPFDLQNKRLPLWVSLFTILIPIYFAFKIHNFYDFLKYASYLLLLPITIAFGLKLYNEGIEKSVFLSSFDISYFNIAFPFLLFYIIATFNEDNKNAIFR